MISTMSFLTVIKKYKDIFFFLLAFEFQIEKKSVKSTDFFVVKNELNCILISMVLKLN